MSKNTYPPMIIIYENILSIWLSLDEPNELQFRQA
jgi:hypothetical protein